MLIAAAVMVVGVGGTVAVVVTHSSGEDPHVPAATQEAFDQATAADEVSEQAETSQPAEQSDELHALISKLDLPEDTRSADECSGLQPRNPAVSSYQVCNGTPATPCKFSLDDTCKVSSVLADGRHSSISYDYEATQFRPPETKAALDRMFGRSRWRIVKPTHFQDGSWFQGQNASWRSGQIKIELMLMGGRNVRGEEYMNASLMFTDTSVPEPLSDGKD